MAFFQKVPKTDNALQGLGMNRGDNFDSNRDFGEGFTARN